MPPMFVLCPLCGRQFGSTSVDIHIPQCHRKAMQQWALLSPSEQSRRPVPPLARVMRPGAVAGVGGAKPVRSAGSAQGAILETVSAYYGGDGGGGGGGGGGVRAPQTLRTPGRGDAPTQRPFPGSNASGWEAPQWPGAAAATAASRQQPPRGANSAPPMAPPLGAGGGMALLLVECRHCGRRFNGDRISRHEGACIEGRGRRAAFNSRKQRLSGFEEHEIGGRSGTRRRAGAGGVGVARMLQPASASSGAAGGGGNGRGPPTSWRQQHRDFIDAVRAGRQYSRQKQQQQQPRYSQGSFPGAGRNISRTSGPSMARAPRVMMSPQSPAVAVLEPARGPPLRQQPQQTQRMPSVGPPRAGAAAGRPFGGPSSVALGGGGGGGGAGVAAARRATVPRSSFGLGGGGGGGGYQISNSNVTSQGMREAFGRA